MVGDVAFSAQSEHTEIRKPVTPVRRQTKKKEAGRLQQPVRIPIERVRGRQRDRQRQGHTHVT